jgi:hypothetical protein
MDVNRMEIALCRRHYGGAGELLTMSGGGVSEAMTGSGEFFGHAGTIERCER